MNPEPDDLNMWEEEISLLVQKSRNYGEQNDLIAFYGSSSIRLWEQMESDLTPHQVLNLGFGGSSYLWCDLHFEEVFQALNPKKIVLYAGDNDLENDTPHEVILGYILSLINKIRKKYGNISLGIISVKPSPIRLYLKEKIELLNSELLAISRNLENCSYINIYREMLNFDGTVRPELFLEDQLHLNPKGYELWKDVIKDHLDHEG